MYADGMELVNAYTELNDPAKQKEMFKLQRLHGGGEDEKCFGDIDNLENQVHSICARQWGSKYPIFKLAP